MEDIARRFVEAFNLRDADELVTLSDPAIEFRPTMLVGARRTYIGHEGLRRWVEELATASLQQRVRVREVRALGPGRFLLLSEVLVDGEPVSPMAMVGRVGEDGRIVEGRAYLTDEEMLTQIGIVAK